MIEPPPRILLIPVIILRDFYIARTKTFIKIFFCKFFKNNLVQFLVLFEFYCLLCDNE